MEDTTQPCAPEEPANENRGEEPANNRGGGPSDDRSRGPEDQGRGEQPDMRRPIPGDPPPNGGERGW
jgi:hypothetical protein